MTEEIKAPYSDVPMTVEIEAYGQILNFESYGDIANWAAEETRPWASLKNYNPPFGQPGVIAINAQLNFFENLEGQAQIAASHNDASYRQQAREKVRDLITTLSQGKRPTSDSAAGKKILAKIIDDPVRATALLAWEIGDLNITSETRHINLFQFIQEMVDARIDQRSGVDDVTAQNESLTTLRRSWAGKFSHLHKEQSDAADNALKLQNDALEHVNGRSKKLSSVAAHALRQMRKDHKDHIDEMDRIRRTFREEMRLRAPATYWRKKAWWHRVGAVLSFAVFAGVVGAIAWTVTHQGPELLKSLSNSQGEISLAAGIVVTIPTLAAFWVLRLISRVFVSNTTLGSDANQRDIMVQTYLALVADEHAQVGNEDRILILNALFRPADGHGSDDALPPNLMEIFKEMGKAR